jgi:PncC family amidohydrolase
MAQLKKLIVALEKNKQTLALAESCSGGYASFLLTKTPGASKVFKGAVVTYSLDTKNRFFKIPAALLKKTGGVSRKVALKLAVGVRKKFNAAIGASLVGFAGPGSSKGVKTGTIFIAVCTKGKKETKKMIIEGGRDKVRKEASLCLINLIYKTCVEI